MPYILPLLPALEPADRRAIARAAARRASPRICASWRGSRPASAPCVLLLWWAPAGRIAGGARLDGQHRRLRSRLRCCWRSAPASAHGSAAAAWCSVAAAATALGGLLLAQSALLAADHLPRMRALVQLDAAAAPLGGRRTPASTASTTTCSRSRSICNAPARWWAIAASWISVCSRNPGAAIADLRQFAPTGSSKATRWRSCGPQDYQQLEALGAADARDIHCAVFGRGGQTMKSADLALILTGVMLNAAAQLLLKAGSRAIAGRAPSTSPMPGHCSSASRSIRRSSAGLACYVISVVVWILALSRVDVSVAYPMLSIGYVVNAIAGLAAVCGEPRAPRAWPASASSSSACWLVARS